MSDDRAPIPRWPAGFHPFDDATKSPQERAESERRWDEHRAFRSGPPPDKPDTRTNTKTPRNHAGSDVRQAENGKAPKHLVLRALAEAPPRQVRFLVPGLIPLRTLTLVAGVGGLGKSTWLAGVAARVSRGELGEPGSVIIVSYEDTTEEMLRPRVQAAGGDLERVFDIVVPEHQGPVVLPSDLSELRECVRSVQAQLVILDPVVAAIDVSFDAHKDQHVRVVLAELAALAEEESLAVAMVGHLNKAPSREAYIRVANSVAFWNASRSVVLVTEDPDEPDTGRLVAQRKANFARLAPIERHRIEPIVLEGTIDPDTGKPIETSRMAFVEYASDVDGDDLLGPRERSEGKTSRAEDFLAFLLADGEWHESGELKKVAAAAGLNERTVQRGAQDLEVEVERRGFPATTWWRLPQSRQGLPHEFGATVDVAQPSALRLSSPSVAPVAPTVSEGAENERAVMQEVAELVDEGVLIPLDIGTATFAELREHFDA